MSVQGVYSGSSVLVLNVTINSEDRVVVIRRKGADGNFTQLRRGVERSQQIYQNLLQVVVRDYDGDVLVKISDAGFSNGTENETHANRGTEQAWNAFKCALEQPTAAESIQDASYSEEDFDQIDPLPIYNAFAARYDNPSAPIDLTEEQKRLCRHWGCPIMASNTFDSYEILRFGARMRRPADRFAVSDDD